MPGKVLARMLPDRVRQKLLTHWRHEQPAFTPKKCRSHPGTPCSQRLCDFRTGLLAVYVDLRKAFALLNQDVLWRILALCGIPPKLVNMICGLYSDTKVLCGVMAPFLTTFQLILECVRDVFLLQHASTLVSSPWLPVA